MGKDVWKSCLSRRIQQLLDNKFNIYFKSKIFQMLHNPEKRLLTTGASSASRSDRFQKLLCLLTDIWSWSLQLVIQHGSESWVGL